jgi:hypothetical protein
MHRPRFSFHFYLLAAIGLASGALALGAATWAGAPRGESYRAPASRDLPAVATTMPLAMPVVARESASHFLDSQPVSPGRRFGRFPSLYVPEADDAFHVFGASPPSFGEEAVADRVSFVPTIANNQILAFYGKPDSKCMGILGEYSKEDLATLLEGYARLYDEINGDEGVVPALYLIYGTCWPGGEIGYLKDSVVREYIDFAKDRGMLVFVDHQIGKYPVAEAMKRLLPWLKYPNVHIALDPEWKTESPMEEIGSVSAEEINAAQATMSDYMNAEGIPGVKMLVLHQFKNKMIVDREKVRADYEGVLLVHTADGFGPPALKRACYNYNSKAENMPLKGVKLFFKTTVKGAGYDSPLLLPSEVLALEPRPRIIIYQ